MTTLLLLASSLVGMDAPSYRTRITSQQQLDRLASPIVKAALWQSARRCPSEEVRHQSMRHCERRYGLTLCHITDEELAEIEEIISALARPKAWRKVSEVEHRHEGHYVRWVAVVWPILGRRMRDIYTGEWLCELDWDRFQADPWVECGLISGVVYDLARHLNGEEDW